jgi:hypothetical protein
MASQPHSCALADQLEEQQVVLANIPQHARGGAIRHGDFDRDFHVLLSTGHLRQSFVTHSSARAAPRDVKVAIVIARRT